MNVKEAWALANALDAFSGSLRDRWLDVYVVVNFLSQVIFIFLLFLGMIMYANEV